MISRIVTVLSLLMVATALAGCAALRAYPDRASDPCAELAALAKYLGPDAIAKYESSNPGDRDGLTQQNWRNAVVNARVHAIDLNFNNFQKGLFEQGIGSQVATDWAVLALNAAGTLTTGGLTNALAATSAGVVGAKAAFDKSVYFEKTLPALVATMEAKRKQILVTIRTGLTKGTDEYPLNLALGHLEDYYTAGTIPGAIVQVTEAAGATSKEADAHLEELTIVVPVPPDLQKRREAMAGYVKTWNSSELDALAKTLGVRTGGEALGDILVKISAAQTSKDFDLLMQKVKILSGREF